MRRIVIRPAARADLFDIWFWSAEQWGETQADAYHEALDRAKLTLLDYPQIGVECGDICSGLRCYSVAEHRIFYLDDGRTIEIVRVLHNRMNADDHLGDL